MKLKHQFIYLPILFIAYILKQTSSTNQTTKSETTGNQMSSSISADTYDTTEGFNKKNIIIS